MKHRLLLQRSKGNRCQVTVKHTRVRLPWNSWKPRKAHSLRGREWREPQLRRCPSTMDIGMDKTNRSLLTFAVLIVLTECFS